MFFLPYALKDIGCPYPIVPPPELYLMVTKHNMSEAAPYVEFGEEVEYGCAEGTKFEKDFDLEAENATCREGNTWDEPNGAWSRCVPSKMMSRYRVFFKYAS